MGVRTHKDLDVWKQAVDLSVLCYDITRGFPREEQFGLTAQMRRAATSIACNIAEGAARATDKEFIHFLYISLGSASELDTQIEIARRNGFGEPPDLEKLQMQTGTISRMLQGLIHSVRDGRSGKSSPVTSSMSPVTGRQSPVTNHESPQ
jgi:four helix bundle protein